MAIITYLKNLMAYRFLLQQLVARDFKVKYKRSILGVLWSVLNPLLMMMVLYMVFSTLFGNDDKTFATYLITGLVLFNFFSEATNTAMSAIVGNFSLITKVYLPRYIFPTSKVVLSAINFLFSLIPLYLVVIIDGVGVNFKHLLIPFVFILLFFFALGVAIFLSAFSVFFRDMFYVYGIMITIWMYMTPILYNAEIIHHKLYVMIYQYNPMYQYISYLRQIVLFNQVPSLSNHLYCIAFSIVSMIIGVAYFRRTQNKFIYYI